MPRRKNDDLDDFIVPDDEVEESEDSDVESLCEKESSSSEDEAPRRRKAPISRRAVESSSESEDDSDDEDAGIRKPSPMDHLLDTPGLLEGLVLCTAHPSSLVRSAAHEELQVAAAEDEVSTIAKRVLENLKGKRHKSVRCRHENWRSNSVAQLDGRLILSLLLYELLVPLRPRANTSV